MPTQKLSPNQDLIRKCLEQDHETTEPNRKDEWAGTTARFRLESRSPPSTLLRFEHEGLTPQLECYQMCEHGWGHFLKTSLKRFAGTGQGEARHELCDAPSAPRRGGGTSVVSATAGSRQMVQ